MRVLISGAGIAGPSLAWHLAKIGAQVTVVEKRKCMLPHGQNVDIQGSAVTIIQKMGLMDDIRRFNTTEKGTQFIDPGGQPFAPFPVKKGHLSSLTSEFEILRGDLAMILYEASNESPNVEYLFDTTIKNVVSNDGDSVKVELSTGELQEFDLLVAADGQWSKVRTQCFSSQDVTEVMTGMYAAYYTIPRIAADNDWWNVYIGLRSRLITLRPDPHGTTRAMFTRLPRDEIQKQAWIEASRSGKQAQQTLLRKDFADAGWQATRLLDAMNQAPDFYFQVISQIKMSHWSTSRVICLGDTAYAPSPLTGMGTSLAIIGGYVLAGELSKLGVGEHPGRALQAYENVFRPFVEREQKIPSVLPGIAHPEGACTRWMYHNIAWCLSNMMAIPWVANRSPKSLKENIFPWAHYKAFLEHET